MCGLKCDQLSSPELLFADHLPQVLDDKLSSAEGLLGADAPALALGTESLQALDPLVSLDALVVTPIGTWTGAGRALSKTHPWKKAIKKMGMNLRLLF